MKAWELTPKAKRLLRRRDRERDREPYRGRHCHQCEGMPWRRPESGKCKCGGRFAEDPEIVAMRPRFWVKGEAA